MSKWGLVVQRGPWAEPPAPKKQKTTQQKIKKQKLGGVVGQPVKWGVPSSVPGSVPSIERGGGSVVDPGTSDRNNGGTTSGDVGQHDNPTGPTESSLVADWVLPQHRAPFVLAISLYKGTPATSCDNYWILPQYTTLRAAVWRAGNLYFVGFKGTSPFGATFDLDIVDDKVIAGLSSSGPDGITLVQQGEAILQDLILTQHISPSNIMLGGHSLGGYAAMMLGQKYQCNVCSFNGGAPPTNPVHAGPGPSKATHYHIVGDLVSSHMDPDYAQVLRVEKHARGYSAGWPHATDRFWKSDPTYGFLSPDQEDAVWLMWGLSPPMIELKPIEVLSKATNALITHIVLESPIPGSTRATSGRTQLLAKLEGLVYAFICDHGAAVMMHVGAEIYSLIGSEAVTGIPLPVDLANVVLDVPPPNGYPGTYYAQQPVEGVVESSQWGEISEAQYLSEMNALPAEASTLTVEAQTDLEVAQELAFWDEPLTLFEQFQAAVTRLNEGLNSMLDSLSYSPAEGATTTGLESSGNFAAAEGEVLWEAPADILVDVGAETGVATGEAVGTATEVTGGVIEAGVAGGEVAGTAAASTAAEAATAAAEAAATAAETGAEAAAAAAEVAAEVAAEAAATAAAEAAAEATAVVIGSAAEGAGVAELVLEILIPILLCNIM